MGFFDFFSPTPAQSQSSNVNNNLLTGIYTNPAQQGVSAQSVLAGGLGVPGGDAAGATAGFEQYQKNSGFQNVLQSLAKGMTGTAAAGGLLRSGPTARAILREGTNLNQQSYNNYLQNLYGLSGLGLQSGGIMANAGQQSTSTGEKASKASVIGNVLSGVASIFSDRRMKTDILEIGKMEDGLPVYNFRYKSGGPLQTGVMADDVAKFRPEALGPKIGGFQTVNYGRL